MAIFNPAEIRSRIEEVVALEAERSSAVARDVAFHMTDWLDDLSAYVDFCRNPSSYTPEQVNSILLAFLLHAPNHLAAASKLFADIPVTDVFGIGAVGISDEGT